MSADEDGFEKFEELVKAIKVQEERMDELERSFMTKDCPHRKEKCIGKECAWFMVCYWLNRQAFHDFLSNF